MGEWIVFSSQYYSDQKDYRPPPPPNRVELQVPCHGYSLWVVMWHILWFIALHGHGWGVVGAVYLASHTCNGNHQHTWGMSAVQTFSTDSSLMRGSKDPKALMWPQATLQTYPIIYSYYALKYNVDLGENANSITITLSFVYMDQ